MPLKLNVGLCKKLGLPEYSSVGASCNLELELDSGLIRDEQGFQDRVREAFELCRLAVEDELARHQAGQPQPTAPDRRPAPAPAPPPNGRRPPSQWGAGPATPPPRPAARPYGRNGQQRDGGQPRTGKALIAHLKGYEEEHPEAAGLFKYVVDWGSHQGYPGRMTEWQFDQVKAAEGAMRQFLSGEPSYS